MYQYNFSPTPYGGAYNRYGMGRGHRWFDFSQPQSETGGENGATEADPELYGWTGSDGGDVADTNPGHHGKSYDQMTSDEFGRSAQDRANRGFLDKALPGIFAGSGLIGYGLSRLDDSMFNSELANRSAAFAGKGQPMPDEFMAMSFDQSDGGLEGWGGFDGTSAGFDGSGQAESNPGDRYKNGGMHKKSAGALPPPRMIRGPGDGRSDSVYANGGNVRVSSGEFVWPADTVSAVGRGSSEAGAKKLGQMAQMIRRQHMDRMGALPPPGAR